MIRYEPDGTATLLGYEGSTGPDVRIGERWEGYSPTGLTATVRRTGQAARADDHRDIPGGEFYLREGLRSAVAVPIYVNGRLWGAIAVGSGEGPLPPGTEQRMAEFTDLVATAVANAQNRSTLEASRDELARLLAEQAALRRVATLIDLHDVRHSYATAGRNARIDWKALSKRIGHADVAFTMKQYVQTDLEADRQVATTLAELILGGPLASAEVTTDSSARTRKVRLDRRSVHRSVHKQHAEGPSLIGRGL
jgi:hypothetical protein